MPIERFKNYIDQYCPLPPTAFEALTQKLALMQLPKNTLLLKEKKVCSHIYFLESGCLRGYYTQGRKEITTWFGFENSFVTSFYSFITQLESQENIQLMEDCMLWAIDYSSIQKLYSQFPEMERLGRIVIEKYYVMLEERFISNHFKEAKARYDQMVLKSPHIVQRVPLGHIASYLGISQETLSRIRNK